jgi:hypothetical protein
MAEKIPGALLEEVALFKDALVAEDKVQVLRVVDDYAWWQGGDGDVEGFVAIETLTTVEPGEELLTRLKEYYPVSYKWKCVWGFSI